MNKKTQIIDGKTLAQKLEKKLLTSIKTLKPSIGIILVKGDKASEIYVNRKLKKAHELGIKTVLKKYKNTVKENIIKNQIIDWNQNPDINGILVQLPLPQNINKYKIINTISPIKDIDGLHSLNIGKLSWQAKNKLTACTANACLTLIKTVIQDLTGMHAVVVGCSNLVGRPVAQLLLQNDCSVTIVHSKTPDISIFTKQADILIVAAGSPNLINADMVKPNAIVIDVGINKLKNGRITGDVNFTETAKIVKAITPVPGGVGPMTIYSLMNNVILATTMQNK